MMKNIFLGIFIFSYGISFIFAAGSPVSTPKGQVSNNAFDWVAASSVRRGSVTMSVDPTSPLADLMEGPDGSPLSGNGFSGFSSCQGTLGTPYAPIDAELSLSPDPNGKRPAALEISDCEAYGPYGDTRHDTMPAPSNSDILNLSAQEFFFWEKCVHQLQATLSSNAGQPADLTTLKKVKKLYYALIAYGVNNVDFLELDGLNDDRLNELQNNPNSLARALVSSVLCKVSNDGGNESQQRYDYLMNLIRLMANANGIYYDPGYLKPFNSNFRPVVLP